MLVVVKDGVEWMAKCLFPYFLTGGDVVDSPFIGNFTESENTYEWKGMATFESFNIVNTNGGPLYGKVTDLETSKTGTIELDREYFLTVGTNAIKIKALSKYICLRITQTFGNPSSNLIKAIELPDEPAEPAYCLLTSGGDIVPMSADEAGKVACMTNKADLGFVVATYESKGGEPTFGDLIGYYTNKGGVTYYYDELLSLVEPMPAEITDVAFMRLADDNVAEEGDDESWNRPFTFDPESATIRVSGATACVHVPIYFYNKTDDANFATPHLRVESADGRLYTAYDGSAMHQKEAELYGADKDYWRFDLWIPAEELETVRQSARKRGTPNYDITDKSQPITPAPSGASMGASNLHLTFTDGKQTDAEPQFVNSPMVKAGIYALSDPAVKPASPLTTIYLVRDEEDSTLDFYVELKQDADGAHLFTGTILRNKPISSDEVISFHISTAKDGSGTNFYAPADVTPQQIASTLSSEADNYNFNGQMVTDDKHNWVIAFSLLDLPESKKEGDVKVAVEISPDGARDISFGFSADDFQTTVDEVTETVGEPLWFNLQGVRLAAPQPGLNIRVQGSKATKVLF